MTEVTDAERMASIYTLCDPRTGEVRYVGVTTQSLGKRLSAHITDKRFPTYRTRWVQSLIRDGIKPVLMVIEVVPVSAASDAEQRWIVAYRAKGARLTNSTSGGLYGVPGLAPESRAKIRHAAVERMKDPARREAVSRVHKGKTISPEGRRAVSEATAQRWIEYRAGERPLSAESRQRISLAAKKRGAPRAMETPEARAKVAEAKRQWWAEWRKNRPAPKTHCDAGHELTDNNVYLQPDGRRRCRRCTLDQAKNRREAAKNAMTAA